ncbi:zinc ribbon domain-containing protein [bacterium]|nr:zinc ribbon domain-containing protein [bacterium]
MAEKINCPFCGNIIDTDSTRCPNCAALFSEPELPNLKFKEFGIFLALNILTYGFFGTLWFFINGRSINKLSNNLKDKIKLNWLVGLLVLNFAAYVFYLNKPSAGIILSLIVFLQILIYISLTYRVIRIIEKYTEKNYGVTLEHNPYYIAIFNILYLIHFIDTYENRVLQTHEYFDAKSPQMILLIGILLILQFVACMDSNIHNFYRWLFRF